MSAREHDAWLLDFDGTLYRARPVKLGMGLELALGGWGAIRCLRAFRAEHEALRLADCAGAASPYALQLERASARSGLDPALVERTVREWMHERPGKWLRRFRNAPLLAEIEAFRAAGGKTALVSDYPARAKLAALGAAPLFDAVVASGEEGGPPRLKPAPDGYLLAARLLGVAPERCLVIGDRPDADGEAARRAGMAFRRVG